MFTGRNLLSCYLRQGGNILPGVVCLSYVKQLMQSLWKFYHICILGNISVDKSPPDLVDQIQLGLGLHSPCAFVKIIITKNMEQLSCLKKYFKRN